MLNLKSHRLVGQAELTNRKELAVVAHTHHADLPVPTGSFVVGVGGSGLLVRGLSAHRVVKGVTTKRHAFARVVVLRASLLVHEQFVALAGEAGTLGWVGFGVGGRFCCRLDVSCVSLASLLPVCSSCCFLFSFLKSVIVE